MELIFGAVANQTEHLRAMLGGVFGAIGQAKNMGERGHRNRRLVQTDESSNQAIGARIRMVRGTRSRREFAKQLKTSQSALNRYENGQREVGARVFVAVCRTHGINPRWLLLGEGTPLIDDAKDGAA